MTDSASEAARAAYSRAVRAAADAFWTDPARVAALDALGDAEDALAMADRAAQKTLDAAMAEARAVRDAALAAAEEARDRW